MQSLPTIIEPRDAVMTPRNASTLPATSHLSRNIIANFVGMFWTALMGPALVAVYIRLMGIEAYGLVGIFTTLQAAFILLDLGLSTATNREMARLSVREHHPEEARDLMRTTETVYWAIAVMIAAIVIGFAPLLAHRWIHAEHLSTGTIQQAFLIMGVILAFQFPFALYAGGLMGLQRQVLLNAIIVSAATVRGVGSVLLLWLVSPTIQVFFVWQLVATVLQTGATAFCLWCSLPDAATQPRFRRAVIRGLWRFSIGMMGISFFALLLTQADKVILSRLLTLEKFGYYALATAAASSLLVIVGPIFTAVFPRFSQLVATDDHAALPRLYHRSCQLMSVAMLPVAIILILFSPEILWVWTRNPVVAQNTHLLVSLLTIGTALNGLMNVPYALQLASGWIKLALYQNIVAVVLLIPLLFWATNHYGALGAAAIWITVNAGYVLVGIQIMHTRLLHEEKRIWYTRDVGLPLAGALSVALVGRWLFPTHASMPITIGGLALVSLSTLAIASMLTPLTYGWLQMNVLPRRFAKEKPVD